MLYASVNGSLIMYALITFLSLQSVYCEWYKKPLFSLTKILIKKDKIKAPCYLDDTVISFLEGEILESMITLRN